jgi:hypothetical protein
MGHAGSLVSLFPTLAASRPLRSSLAAESDSSREISLIVRRSPESNFRQHLAIREAASHLRHWVKVEAHDLYDSVQRTKPIASASGRNNCFSISFRLRSRSDYGEATD